MKETETPSYPVLIFRVRSRKTNVEYFLAIPSADTDVVTNGLILLVSSQRAEIHLLDAEGDEYQLGPVAGGQLRAERENAAQNRSDLVAIELDNNQRSKRSRICRFAFRDIFADGHADAIETVEVATFLKEGGKIVDGRVTTLPDYDIPGFRFDHVPPGSYRLVLVISATGHLVDLEGELFDGDAPNVIVDSLHDARIVAERLINGNIRLCCSLYDHQGKRVENIAADGSRFQL